VGVKRNRKEIKERKEREDAINKMAKI